MPSPKFLVPLALIALTALPGCSRAQKPAEAQSPATPQAPPAEITNVSAPQPATVDSVVASAPHPEILPTNAPSEAPVPSAPVAPPEKPAANSGLTLHLLVPAGHAPAWLVEELQTALGAKVTVQTYLTDNERDKDMQASPSGYDVIGISDLAAADLIGQQKLSPLPANLAPLEDQPEPEFLHHYFDPKSQFTWPYGFTLLGFASAPAAETVAPPALRTWRELETLPVSLPEDGPLRSALWALAEAKPAPGLNEPIPATWQKATYEEPALQPDQPSKVWIDTLSRLHPLLSRPNEKWDVVLPPEGSLITLYHWAIPAATPQPQLAEAALRALVVPARAARIDVENDLGVTQAEARKLLAPAMAADPLIYPVARVMSQCRFVRLK